MSDIFESVSKIWKERLTIAMKKKGYKTQDAFIKSYKTIDSNCTQATVSRWCRVGDKIESTNKIGFPKYESMKKVADFLDVSVGYLTGETDFETFEMEKSCNYLHIEETTGIAIRNISTGYSIEEFGKNSAPQYAATFKYLVTSKIFPLFIKQLKELSDIKYRLDHPINHLDLASKKINPDIIDLAYQCLDYKHDYDDEYGEIDDFKQNNIIPTPELLEAIKILNEAIDMNYFQAQELKQELELSEYRLSKTYFKLIEEITVDEHLSDMIDPFFIDKVLK